MEKTFKELAARYELSIEFVRNLFEKIEDKENFVRAVRMFDKGTLPYDKATGNGIINVREIRHHLAQVKWDCRKKIQAHIEYKRRVRDFLASCKALRFPLKKNPFDVVWVKDGRLVAFGRFEPKQGGIYMANNEAMGEYEWNPHKALARLRNLNKAFYRQIKKAAFDSPVEWFNFNLN